MKKRLLSVLLSLAMVLAMSPVVSAVESPKPWTASGKLYATVQAALDNVLQNEPNTTAVTITLSEDYEGDAAIEIDVKAGFSLTIDLGVKSFKVKTSTAASITGEGSVTIKNGSISTEGGSTVLESSANELILEDTTLTGGNNDGNSTLKITGGDVTISGTTELDSGKSRNTAINLVSGKCTIQGGTFDGKITNSDDITGGYFNGNVTCRGTITGGIFYGGITNTDNGKIDGLTITYINGGSEYAKQVLQSDETAIKPIDPTQTGYIFGGWCEDSECKNAFDFDNTTIKEDTMLYAGFREPTYTVTFSTDHGSVDQETVTIDDGGTVTKPDDPTATGYTFGGWYTDENFTTEYAFDTPVTTDITLYAEWTENSDYTIVYDTAGGSTTKNKTGVKWTNTVLTDITNPTREGYKFTGWKCGDVEVTNDTTYADLAIDDTVMSVTLTAQWNAIIYNDDDPSYSITVNEAQHGTVTSTRRYAEHGEDVTLTVEPDKGCTLETLTVTDLNGKEVDLDIVEIGEKYTFKMPSGKVTVTATFMEDNTMLNYFVDVNAQDYFYDAVLWAVENGVTYGIDDSHFAPNEPCTRAQIVTFLWRAAGSPEPKSLNSFTDVAADSYYAKAVAWAVEKGITYGMGNGEFSPNATCTRAQAVTFRYRASGSPAVSGSSRFDDVADSAYYADAVKWAETEGITDGTGSNTFSPNSTCTRAQIVTFIYRALGK